MASYNPPSENLPSFNPAVFSDNFTPDQVDTKIKTLETKTTQLTYNGVNDNSTFGSQLVIQDTGDNTEGELNLNHQLRLTTGTDDRTLVLGYDNTADLGYINASKSGSTQPLCLQTRGSNVGIGLTNPTELLDVNGVIKSTNLKTANHTDVDATLTTLNTKTTGISYDSGTSKTTITNISTSNDIEIRESNINFNRNDGSSAGILQYQSEGITIKETRGGNDTTIIIGGADINFKTGSSSDSKFTITEDAQPTVHIGTNTGIRGASIKMEGVDGDIGLDNCVLETRQYDGFDESELVIFKGNDHSALTNTDRIRLRAGQLAFDCYSSPTSDRTAEDIKATIDSNGLSILTNPITASTVNDGVNDWDIRIPIQCSLTKLITNSATTTNIRLPRNIGNFSGGPNNAMVYLLNISRSDGDWNTSDRPSYLGLLQLSTFSTKKARLLTIVGGSNQINSIAVAEVGNDIELQVQVGCALPTTCKITLTQIR